MADGEGGALTSWSGPVRGTGSPFPPSSALSDANVVTSQP
jgi:hypothetical protein